MYYPHYSKVIHLQSLVNVTERYICLLKNVIVQVSKIYLASFIAILSSFLGGGGEMDGLTTTRAR